MQIFITSDYWSETPLLTWITILKTLEELYNLSPTYFANIRNNGSQQHVESIIELLPSAAFSHQILSRNSRLLALLMHTASDGAIGIGAVSTVPCTNLFHLIIVITDLIRIIIQPRPTFSNNIITRLPLLTINKYFSTLAFAVIISFEKVLAVHLMGATIQGVSVYCWTEARPF